MVQKLINAETLSSPRQKWHFFAYPKTLLLLKDIWYGLPCAHTMGRALSPGQCLDVTPKSHIGTLTSVSLSVWALLAQVSPRAGAALPEGLLFQAAL